jgi:hypothetical protein
LQNPCGWILAGQQNYPDHMFSLQKLFSKGDRFQELLEAAAQESHESVRLVIELIKSPRNSQNFDDLCWRAARKRGFLSRSAWNWGRLSSPGLHQGRDPAPDVLIKYVQNGRCAKNKLSAGWRFHCA